MTGSIIRSHMDYPLVPDRDDMEGDVGKKTKVQEKFAMICLAVANLILFGLIFYCLYKGIQSAPIAGF
ncbi:MAG: hypothetical protein KJ638_00295 [Chloroflexi bacterium]|nr:hypothetical protein [Chloroflexota bacterium]